jgi:hypothetical protein
MGDEVLTAAGRRDVLLPTDFVVSQRRYRSAECRSLLLAGRRDDSVLSIGWQWTDWRTDGAGLKCGEREREPSEAGARERGRYVWKVKRGASGMGWDGIVGE